MQKAQRRKLGEYSRNSPVPGGVVVTGSWPGKTNSCIRRVGLFGAPKNSKSIFFEKYFLSFLFSFAPPPFFSTRYLIKCYIIDHPGRRSMSESRDRREMGPIQDLWRKYGSRIDPIKDKNYLVILNMFSRELVTSQEEL